LQVEQAAAVEAVAAVLAGKSLTPTLEHLFAEQVRETAQRAAVFDISHGTLRQLGLLRALNVIMLRKPPSPLRLEVLLHVALYQLAFTRAAAHAVVDQAVRSATEAG
jgi:16S rRNA (cytosine967-C5)-methyltransferase